MKGGQSMSKLNNPIKQITSAGGEIGIVNKRIKYDFSNVTPDDMRECFDSLRKIRMNLD